MKWILAVAALAALSTPALSRQRPLLYDPVALNMGVNCAWQQDCMATQRRAMNAALRYVSIHRPPHSRIQRCNRKSSRGGVSMDWAGFERCIRKAAPARHPARRMKKRRR